MANEQHERLASFRAFIKAAEEAKSIPPVTGEDLRRLHEISTDMAKRRVGKHNRRSFDICSAKPLRKLSSLTRRWTVKDHRMQGAVLIALVLSVLLLCCESNNAENQRLAIYGTVHVYRSLTLPADYPGSDFIGVIGPKDRVKVMQVVRKRNYMAVRIRLCDGREGWVFSGEGIELYAPGCRGPDFRAC